MIIFVFQIASALNQLNIRHIRQTLAEVEKFFLQVALEILEYR